MFRVHLFSSLNFSRNNVVNPFSTTVQGLEPCPCSRGDSNEILMIRNRSQSNLFLTIGLFRENGLPKQIFSIRHSFPLSRSFGCVRHTFNNVCPRNWPGLCYRRFGIVTGMMARAFARTVVRLSSTSNNRDCYQLNSLWRVTIKDRTRKFQCQYTLGIRVCMTVSWVSLYVWGLLFI